MHDYSEDEQDYEASNALDTLFRGEEIKKKDSDFIERISEEIDRRQSILSNIRDSLEYLCGEDDDDDMEEDSGGTDLNDFFSRIQRAKKKQMMAQEETPSERRRRIYKKGEPVIGGVLVTKFT